MSDDGKLAFYAGVPREGKGHSKMTNRFIHGNRRKHSNRHFRFIHGNRKCNKGHATEKADWTEVADLAVANGPNSVVANSAVASWTQMDESQNFVEEQNTEWGKHVVHGKASLMEREHGSKETGPYQDGSPRGPVI